MCVFKERCWLGRIHRLHLPGRLESEFDSSFTRHGQEMEKGQSDDFNCFKLIIIYLFIFFYFVDNFYFFKYTINKQFNKYSNYSICFVVDFFFLFYRFF